MRTETGFKYQKIRDLLVEHFRESEYQPETRLPTEMELTQYFHVSRTTIRQALAILEKDGVIEKKHGSGTFFVGHKLRHPDVEASKGLIGFVSFFFMDYIYPDIVSGAEEELFENGYSLALANCKMDREKELESVVRLLDQDVKGLVIEPSRNADMKENHPLLELIYKRNVPVVSTHWGVSDERLSTVSVNDESAGYQATRYLIERGHRRIGMVFKADVAAGVARYAGYRKAMTEAGLPVDPNALASFTNDDERLDIDQGGVCTRRILAHASLESRVTGIVYFNDRTAQQGYLAIRESGLTIPDDISVIGYDNYRTSSMLQPGLTTFEHPKYELGKWAARLLIHKIERGEQTLPMKLFFQPVLVERASVRRL
ncbi:MAG: GntR family transcriptional regulator [Spirochaetota bacterium]